MTSSLDGLTSAVFILFCRIGACIMTMPGLSSQRIPARVRLYIAIGVTLALAPPLMDTVKPIVVGASVSVLSFMLVTELIVGLLIGFMARLFFFALETLGSAVATAIGLSNILGAPIDEAEPLPAMTSFIVLAATTLFFIMDQHWEILRGLFSSYSAIPISRTPSSQIILLEYTKVLEQAFLLALRISSPLLLFSLIANLASGFLNRLAPQIPVYFIVGPLLIALGTYSFYLMSDDFFAAFSTEFRSWLRSG
ncbi:MAG: flagellar biosynthetic protein FliR [Methylocystis sp.]|nr:flagellar biosynthetic protein FliR [Methylocystis sp.]